MRTLDELVEGKETVEEMTEAVMEELRPHLGKLNPMMTIAIDLQHTSNVIDLLLQLHVDLLAEADLLEDERELVLAELKGAVNFDRIKTVYEFFASNPSLTSDLVVAQNVPNQS